MDVPQGPTSNCPIPNVGSDQIKDMLPKKGFWQQVGDGCDSYFDGLGWSLTMFAAKRGALGPEIQGQSEQITRSMAVGVAAIAENPQQARAAASAVAQTYPWQMGSRMATSALIGYSSRIGGRGGLLLTAAATEGSMAHLAFSAGDAATVGQFVLAGVAGEICGGQR